MMESVMTEMEYDIKKMPLGKLTKGQIKSGYEVLKELDEAIKKNSGGTVLAQLSSKFYTLIPHSFGMIATNFIIMRKGTHTLFLGRTVPPVINNNEKLKQKMRMLEALADIEIATKLMQKSEEDDSSERFVVIYLLFIIGLVINDLAAPSTLTTNSSTVTSAPLTKTLRSSNKSSPTSRTPTKAQPPKSRRCTELTVRERRKGLMASPTLVTVSSCGTVLA